MSAAKALSLARNQKTIVALEHHMHAKNISSAYELAKRIWGVDAKGIPRKLHRLYPVLNGKNPISPDDAADIAAFFQIPVEDLIVQDNANSAVAIYQPPPQQRATPARATAIPNEFTFTINSGRAAVALNLTDLDVQTAMRIVAALGAIGVIPGLPKAE